MKALCRTLIRRIRDARLSQKMFWSFFLVSTVTLLPLGISSYLEAELNVLYREIQSTKEFVWQVSVGLNNKLLQFQSMVTSLLYNDQIIQCLNVENMSYFDQYLMFSNTLEPTINSVIAATPDVLRLKIYTGNETLQGHSRYFYALADAFPSAEAENYDELDSVAYRLEAESLTILAKFPYSSRNQKNLLQIDFLLVDTLSPLMKNGNRLCIFSQSGELVFASPGMEECLPEMDSADSVFSTTIDGTKYYAFRNEISETGWHCVCYVPERNLVAADRNILSVTVFYYLLAIVLCSLMSSILCRLLTEPIKKLQYSIRQVENEDFSIQLSSPYRDEIGQLTNSFGSMVRKLNTLIHEVYQSQIVQKEAEFKMLQSQLNPHFLYNTLSFINWKAIQAGQNDIARISRDISSFYRTALNSGKSLTTVREELINAKSYVNIQLALHNNSFDVSYQVEDSVQSDKVICNLLQPLIENALEHGIDRKRDGRGQLIVSITGEDGCLALRISDNGPGFSEPIEQLLRCDSKGYGLKNVNERIKIYYGEEFGITAFEKGGMTTIEIKIPI